MAANAPVVKRERRATKAVVNFMSARKDGRARTGAEPWRTGKVIYCCRLVHGIT